MKFSRRTLLLGLAGGFCASAPIAAAVEIDRWTPIVEAVRPAITTQAALDARLLPLQSIISTPHLEDMIIALPTKYRSDPAAFAVLPEARKIAVLRRGAAVAGRRLDKEAVALSAKAEAGAADEGDARRLAELSKRESYLSPERRETVRDALQRLAASGDQANVGAFVFDGMAARRQGTEASARSLTRMKRQVIDLSLPITKDILRFPGDPEPEIVTEAVPFGGNHLTMTRVSLGLHIGTHIDAPSHFVPGTPSIGDIAPDTFIGKVYVVDLSKKPGSAISAEMLRKARIPRNVERVFIKTSNSVLIEKKDYSENHAYLTPDAAQYLVDIGAKIVGFDYYDVDPTSVQSLPSHTLLANAHIPVIVALRMAALSKGYYQMAAAPLSLPGIEASPVRVLLWK